MNIITFRLYAQFNSIFPVVKIISEWLLFRTVFSLVCEAGRGGRRGGKEGYSACWEEDASGKVPRVVDDGGDTGG